MTYDREEFAYDLERVEERIFDIRQAGSDPSAVRGAVADALDAIMQIIRCIGPKKEEA